MTRRRRKEVGAPAPVQDAAARSDAERAEWVVSELRALRAAQRKGGARLKAEDLVEEGRER